MSLRRKHQTQHHKTGRRRLTLLDLAAHAGVSRATVSLVLAKSPLVAEATRARVLESARLLGYVYNRGAANLRTRRTHTIGVAINEITNPYFTELTAVVQRAFLAHGRTVFISDSQEDPDQQDHFVATMREYNADGLVICPALGTAPERLRILEESGVPAVLLSRDVPGSGLDYAGHANRRGMAMATEHMIRLGHRRIAMIGGVATTTGEDRHAGYRDALAAHDIPADPRLIVGGGTSRLHGAEAIRQLLDTLSDPPTAAVCFNDVVAFGVMLGLRQAGREPGRDFAVSGYDDLAEGALWMPGLTTIRIDSRAIGTAAVELLLDRIEQVDTPPRRFMSEPELVVRQSSCPPVDRPAARALTVGKGLFRTI